MLQSLFKLSNERTRRVPLRLICPIMALIIAPTSSITPASHVHMLVIGHRSSSQAASILTGIFYWPHFTKIGAFFGLVAPVLYSFVFVRPADIHAGTWDHAVNIRCSPSFCYWRRRVEGDPSPILHQFEEDSSSSQNQPRWEDSQLSLLGSAPQQDRLLHAVRAQRSR